jgi:helicase
LIWRFSFHSSFFLFWGFWGTLFAKQLKTLGLVVPGRLRAIKNRRASSRGNQAARRFGAPVVSALQRFVGDHFAYYARCKRASVLWDWINGVPVERIEEAYTANPIQGKIGYGDIRKFADATRFHLGAAHRITNILFVTGGPTEESIDHLLRQLEIGLPAQALGLIDIPADLTRGDYLALLRAGIQTVDQVWRRSDEQLVQILGSPVGRLISSRKLQAAMKLPL